MSNLSDPGPRKPDNQLRIGIPWDGQCVHNFVAYAPVGEWCNYCQTHCTRDAKGMIETYAAGGKH